MAAGEINLNPAVKEPQMDAGGFLKIPPLPKRECNLLGYSFRFFCRNRQGRLAYLFGVISSMPRRRKASAGTVGDAVIACQNFGGEAPAEVAQGMMIGVEITQLGEGDEGHQRGRQNVGAAGRHRGDAAAFREGL